jgi:Flp pilus assembly protein TadG
VQEDIMKHYSFSKDEQGQAIVIMALAMIALLAFAALAIDGANAYVERRRAQNGADAGALAGARQIWMNRVSLDTSETQVLREINETAEKNGIGDTNGIGGDTVNDYVRSYYTDRNGNPLTNNGQPIAVGTSGSIPSTAAGLKVYASRDFRTFIAGIIGRTEMGAMADATAVFWPPPTCGDYAIYATGPSGNNQSVHVTGSNGGGGDNFQIVDGGIYGGAGGVLQNSQIVGGGLTVDIVGGCTGNCTVGGTATINYNAQSQTAPVLYDIADYQPGGTYAVYAQGLGQYFQSGSRSFNGNIPTGLYYVNGDVDLQDVTGDATIVATGDIRITGGERLSTYDPRMPVLFTTSSNTNSGAIASHNPTIELHGFIYAPNGAVKISGAQGVLYGAIYGQEVNWDSARASIVYEPAFCPPDRARVLLLK